MRLAIVLFYLFPSFCFCTDYFDSALTKVIAVNESSENILYRGDIPRKSNSFDEKSLIASMKIALNTYKDEHPEVSLSFPKKYNLIVISNLTYETAQEADFIEIMYRYFTRTSSKKSISTPPMKEPIVDPKGQRGTWYWWQVRAFYDNNPALPEDVSWEELASLFDSLTRSSVQTFLVDQTFDGRTLDYVNLINLLGDLLDTDESKSQIIYFHSRHGINRTGAMTCSYLMQYNGEEIETAYENMRVYDSEGVLIPEYEPQKLKSFLFFFKRYLELWRS